jgi:hypothetical protein
VFRFGGNHSPRGVKLRQVGPIAFASVPGPFRSSPSGEPRGPARRGARWWSRGYIQVGKRGNAVGSWRRRHWPSRGPAREHIQKNESQPRPSSEGRASGRDGSGTLRVSPLLRGTTEGGARALSRPFPAPAAAATTVAVRADPVDPNGGSMRPGTRLALRGDIQARYRPGSRCGAEKGPLGGRARSFPRHSLGRWRRFRRVTWFVATSGLSVRKE